MSEAPIDQAIDALNSLGNSGASSDQVAALFAFYWKEIEVVLTPLIGEVSVATLHQRCLFRTSEHIPWLKSAFKGTQAPVDLVDVVALISQQLPPDAAVGTGAFLKNFNEKLASLLGRALTDRLFDLIWLKFFDIVPASDIPS
ncbi:MAG: hypothetical protein H7232_10255 [Aeromicrobium sp.]|nr:hypothetical protein [Burkholderiales bacterium]